MGSVLEAGPVVRTNQLDFDDEVIFKSTQYLYNHVRYKTSRPGQEDQPFALTVSMTHPHDPYAMTREFWDMYEGVDIPLPNKYIPDDQQDPHARRLLKVIDLLGNKMPEDRIIAARRAYFAACTYVDTQIGKLLKVLKDTGLAENTIIVFTGDHGDMLGERNLWYKMAWYEMAARVPMLVHWPGKFAPKRVSENVSTMDLLPTFAAMGGATLVPGLPMDGVSLMPYIDGRAGPKMDTVIGEYMGEGTMAPLIMIKRGRYKFVYSPIDPPQLFDLVADPSESVNLAAPAGEGKLALPAHYDAEILSQHTEKLSISGPKPVSASLAQAQNEAYTPPDTPNNAVVTRNPLSAQSTPPSGHASVLSDFLKEVSDRWDLEKIRGEVLRSQRQRRMVYGALTKGVATTWEYVTPVDPAAQYIRNQSTRAGALDDVEWVSRWPRLPQGVISKGE
jgi:choline-sulfatase